MTFRAIALAFASAAAATTASANNCTAIENDLDRLACYDKVAGVTPTPTVTATPEGKWVLRETKSEFKDTTDVFATVRSEDTLTCRNYGTPQKAVLMLRCSENTTALFISTDCHLASGVGGYGQVEYRFGDKPAHVREFSASTDHSALGLWSGSAAIPFIKAMSDSDRVLFRFTPYGQNPVIARFDITGIEEAIKPLRKECGW